MRISPSFPLLALATTSHVNELTCVVVLAFGQFTPPKEVVKEKVEEKEEGEKEDT